MVIPKIIKALEKENESEWILTSEKLPKNKEKVLYVTKDNMIYSGVYYDKNSVNVEWGEFRDVFDNDDDVIAWQPYLEKYDSKQANKYEHY